MNIFTTGSSLPKSPAHAYRLLRSARRYKARMTLSFQERDRRDDAVFWGAVAAMILVAAITVGVSTVLGGVQ
jgi:hypothetical protein